MHPKSYYEILGVSSAASKADIKRAFYRISLEVHPDLISHKKGEKPSISFHDALEAYKTLTDDRLRHLYDASLNKLPVRPTLRTPNAPPNGKSKPGFNYDGFIDKDTLLSGRIYQNWNAYFEYPARNHSFFDNAYNFHFSSQFQTLSQKLKHDSDQRQKQNEIRFNEWLDKTMFICLITGFIIAQGLSANDYSEILHELNFIQNIF